MKKSQYIALLLLGFLVIGVTGGVWTTNQFIYKPGLGARGELEKNSFDSGLDRVDARLGKEIWVGDPDYGTTLQDAITAISTDTCVLRVPPGTHSISAALTIPANITLKVERGATLAIATTKTLTINGGFEAGLYQCITCAGTGTVVFGNQVPAVYPQWTGAVGNNSTDDSAAINCAATMARASACKRIILPPCAGYAATAQLDLRGLSVESPSKITTSYAGNGVLIGGVGANDGRKLNIELEVDRSLDWTAGRNAIMVSNLSESVITLSAHHSAIGVLFQAGEYPMCYNTIILKRLAFNKVALQVYCPNGVAGWVNENLVLGGNFGNTNAGGECGIKFLAEGTGGVNHWVFEKPCIECTYADYAVIFDGAISNCQLNDIRFECGSDVKVANFKNGAQGNTISIGSMPINRMPFAVDFETTGGTWENDVRMSGDYSLHRLNDVSTFGYAYNDGTYLHVPGFEIINLANGVSARKWSASGFELKDGHGGACLYETSGGTLSIGITVSFYGSLPNNWTPSKKLYVKHRVLETSDYSAVYLICFDSSGNILSGSDPPYAQGCAWAPYSYGYLIHISSTLQMITFHKDVAYVKIGIKYTNKELTGLEVYSPYQADGYLSYSGPKELPGCLLASNAPTKWHFQVGDRVLNDAPSSGNPQGWVCTKRTDTTLTANGSGGDTTITVASIAGIASGDIIGVKLDTGLYHFTTVNGAPAGSTVTLTAALPGSGVVATSGKAVVANLWANMPDL